MSNESEPVGTEPSVYEQAKEVARDDLSRTELTNLLYDFPHVCECVVDGEDKDWQPTRATVRFDDDAGRDTSEATTVMQCGGYKLADAAFELNRLTFVDREDSADEWVEDDNGEKVPRRSEPADFGGGESTGVQDL